MKKLRVCRITSVFPPPWSGLAPGPYELSLVQYLRGIDLIVVTRDCKGAETIDKKLPFSVIRIPSNYDIEFSFKAANKFRELNKNNPFNLIHGHGFSSIGVLIAKRMRICNIPVVTTMHNVRIEQRAANLRSIRYQREEIESKTIIPSKLFLSWERLQEKFVVEHSDCLVSVSEGVKDAVLRHYNIESKKIFIAGNGVDVNNFSPHSKMINNTMDVINLLWVGRFSGFKGELDLVCACELLKKRNMRFHLIMIGDGNEFNRIEKAIQDKNLGQEINIIKYVDFTEIPNYYKNAHVFVLPSISEGMPKVLLEAMSCGLPIIATDISGCRELVKEGVNGFLIPVNRPDVLAEKILVFYKNPQLIKKMGLESRKIVEQNYTWDAVAERIQNAYEICLRNNK